MPTSPRVFTSIPCALNAIVEVCLDGFHLSDHTIRVTSAMCRHQVDVTWEDTHCKHCFPFAIAEKPLHAMDSGIYFATLGAMRRSESCRRSMRRRTSASKLPRWRHRPARRMSPLRRLLGGCWRMSGSPRCSTMLTLLWMKTAALSRS